MGVSALQHAHGRPPGSHPAHDHPPQLRYAPLYSRMMFLYYVNLNFSVLILIISWSPTCKRNSMTESILFGGRDGSFLRWQLGGCRFCMTPQTETANKRHVDGVYSRVNFQLQRRCIPLYAAPCHRISQNVNNDCSLLPVSAEPLAQM